MTNGEMKALTRRMGEEAGRNPAFAVLFELDLSAALAIAGNLQLALRYPGNSGPSAEAARVVIAGIVDQMRRSGFEAWAQVAEMGNRKEAGNDENSGTGEAQGEEHVALQTDNER